MTDLVTIGETMALFTTPTVGPMRHVHELRVGIAGSESNVAIGVSRLGLSTAWIGRVGDDEFGRRIVATLRSEGVGVAGVAVDPETPTGLMFKERRTAHSTRVTYYRRGNAGTRLCADDVDEAVIGDARALHTSAITPALSTTAREATFVALEAARSAGALVSLDLNYRLALWQPDEAAPVMRDLVGRSDVVLATVEEAALMFGRCSPREAAKSLASLGPSQVVVKRGAEGAVALIDGDEHDVPAVPVEAVDPVGAGDGFAAGYLAALLEGKDATGRLDLASRAGAFAVTVEGDWEGLPRRDELELLDVEAGDVRR